MKGMNSEKEMAVHCGKVTDSMETLETLCCEKAEKLLTTLDVPELIAVGKFSRDKSGKVIYELDFSESTL